MPQYRLNPYASFVESRLFPEFVQYAVFHRLTGELVELNNITLRLMHAVKAGTRVSFDDAGLERLGQQGNEIKLLIGKELLIPESHDPLKLLCEQYVARPIQNPALIYQSKKGEWILVRTSMQQLIYSRKRNELPQVFEEVVSPLAAGIFRMADGTKTLYEIFSTLRGTTTAALLDDAEFGTAIEILTSQERQVIKVTPRPEDLDDPFKPVNIVPRNLYHAERWEQSSESSREKMIDFHLAGIEDAGWEFDQIEPTVNHCFRFSHEALGGLDYGSRFCVSALRREYVPLLDHPTELNVLEVGGGTGVFARSLIEQAQRLDQPLNYHILDLSPALMESQRKILSELLPQNRHFQQDATCFDLPGLKFDLIIANEVIADFPVAHVQRSTANESNSKWEGDGAPYIYQYDFPNEGAPDSFFVNAGAFNFIERAWKHLTPGGTLFLSEYGLAELYPTRSAHLNHDEFSIHFGHLVACGTKVGFECRLLTLKEFMSFDDEVKVLNGREEHILCLNHIFRNYGVTLPYAVLSRAQFERQCQDLAEQISLTGYSFSPLNKRYHYGPNIEDFQVLVLTKPFLPNEE